MEEEVKGVDDRFIEKVRTCLKQYTDLWQQFGLPREDMVNRLDEVWVHVGSRLVEIYEEDFASFQKVQKRVKNLESAVDTLARVLQVKAIKSEGKLLSREQILREELNRLSKMKQERLESWSQLLTEMSSHRAALNVEGSVELRSRKAVPSEKDLENLRLEVEELNTEVARRTAILKEGHAELRGAMARGEWAPGSVFEKELLGQVGDNLPLSKETVHLMEATLAKVRSHVESLSGRKRALVGRLHRLWKSLGIAESDRMRFPNDCRLQTLMVMEAEADRLEEVRKRKMDSLVKGLQNELEDLWDKCHVTLSDRRRFRSSAFSEVDGGVLELHEDEVDKWRRLYSEAAPILAKMDRRQELWDQMVELETNPDPKRFQNRGCRLLQEEKERRRLQKELPALEEEIFRDLEEYELMSGGPLLYHGEDYRNFVSNQWAQRLNQKEFEKQERRRKSTESTPATTPSSGRSRTPSRAITPRKASKSSSGGSSAGCTPLGIRPKNGRLFGTPSSAKKALLEPLSAKELGDGVDTVDGISASPKKKEPLLFPPKRDQTPQRPVQSPLTCKIPQRKQNTPLSKTKDRRSQQKEDRQPHRPVPPFLNSKSPQKDCEPPSMNGTTYTDFAEGLDQSNFHSSVLTEKNGKRGRKALKKTGARKSVRTVRTAPKFSPKRGKSGLPFLI